MSHLLGWYMQQIKLAAPFTHSSVSTLPSHLHIIEKKLFFFIGFYIITDCYVALMYQTQPHSNHHRKRFLRNLRILTYSEMAKTIKLCVEKNIL